jgi:predicted ABC-type transport system involved in lysophospholipase L1 biosynthesis ATPase subunit
MSETDMTDYAELETPLVELLERVPEDARAWYEHGPTNHSHIPYGLLSGGDQKSHDQARSIVERRDDVLGADESSGSGRCRMTPTRYLCTCAILSP